MKKNLLYILMSLALVACATKKPEKRSKFLKGFSAQYNTLFNAQDALNTEFDTRSEAHRDNFYAPYINILTYEEMPVGSDLGQSPAFSAASSGRKGASALPSGIESVQGAPIGRMPAGDQGTTPAKGATILEIAEAKALKTIDKYSVIREGQEENDKIFDAYITLAQARIYMGKPLSALDALNQVFTKMKDDKRLPLARIYQGLAFAKMGDHFKANDIFTKLKSEKLKDDYAALLSIYHAESLLDSGKKEEAIKELASAYELNGSRNMRSRIAFLRGQILNSVGRNAEARDSFTSAYKYSNDFEFEVKSQIEIAKTFNDKNDYSGAKKYIEDISKKGTYASRKNEFYYALGLMANKAGKKEEAQEYFRKSLAEEVSDPQIRGLNFYEIGKGYFDNNDYISAGAYYDSAIAVMTYEPSKVLLQEQSSNIKKLATNYYLVKKNDSILALTRMSDADRQVYFAKHIEKIKAKEEALERERIRAERQQGFDTGDYSANSVFAGRSSAFQDFGGGSKGFYFSNTTAISRGSQDFRQVWGNRALVDNWRYGARMTTLDDAKNLAMGQTTVQDPRRFESSFYIEKIPTSNMVIEGLKKDRDTAALGMGIMYDDFFLNRPLATSTLYTLVDNKPEEKVMLRALYEIFSMNYEKNPQIAERAKQILLTDYPYTSYAEFARNPRSGSFMKSNAAVEQAYRTAFSLYENEKFEDSRLLIDQTLTQYPQDALVPKFTLLNAFNAGKTSGKEVMILQLEQIALNYKDTQEGIKAAEMLQWLKSDLNFVRTDNTGNPVTPQQPVQPPVGTGNNDVNVRQQEEIRRQENERKARQIPRMSPSIQPGAPTQSIPSTQPTQNNPYAPPPVPNRN